MDPAPFASFLFVMFETVCMQVSGLPDMGACRSTPAASMRSVHPILSIFTARRTWQPARKTGFRMLVQPISSSLWEASQTCVGISGSSPAIPFRMARMAQSWRI